MREQQMRMEMQMQQMQMQQMEQMQPQQVVQLNAPTGPMADAFCEACNSGELEAVRRLLAEGVSPDSVASYGDPALCRAVAGL